MNAITGGVEDGERGVEVLALEIAIEGIGEENDVSTVRPACAASSVSLPPNGIFILGSVCLIAVRRMLLAGSPGTIAGPRVPPFVIVSMLSTRRPPICEFVWHV